VNVLDHPDKQVRDALLSPAIVESGGMLGVFSEEMDDFEDGVGDAGDLYSQLLRLFMLYVQFVSGYAVLEDGHFLVYDHVLDGLAVQSGDVGFN
jgi:hypothetical protein